MKYSIITINYNNRDGLERTIQSVINQTYQDFEYIIIDGGSTDGSVDIIKKYADRIDYWVSEPDKGIYNAMNKGVLQAHGTYVNFMNSGDCFYSNEVLRTVLKYLSYDIILGKSYYQNGPHGFKKKNISFLDLYKNSLPHQAAFCRRELFDNSLFDENYKIVSDWKFFLDTLLFKNASFLNVDDIICLYEFGGISSTAISQVDVERATIINSYFPERVISDYEFWCQIDSPILKLIPQMSQMYYFQKFVYYLIVVLLKINSIFRQ